MYARGKDDAYQKQKKINEKKNILIDSIEVVDYKICA
jgi:hypothetical protein